VTEVDGHADTVHPIDDLSSILTHATVIWLEGSVGDASSEVVAKLRNTLAISIAAIHIVKMLELIAVLQSKENTELALLLGFCQVGGAVNTHQPLGILRDKAVPFGEQQLNICKVIRALAEVDHGHSSVLEPLKIRLAESARLGQPLLFEILLIDAIQKLVQHVDHQRFAHEAHDPLRVFLR
jgi:hypothetical protein